LTRGTGRFNVAQGAVATAQGLGASLSATVAGIIIVGAGYTAAFLALAAIAGLGFVAYLFLMPETRTGAGPSAGKASDHTAAAAPPLAAPAQ
ncbi:MAG: MFS transporter, partial [Caulobacteraceae bacterium]|nr:MFS transporter [Caulobacter sp.]